MPNDNHVRNIAIVAWQALPAVFPELGRGVGGIETAAWTFAKSLAQRPELRSTLVVRSDRALPATQVDGVAIRANVDPWMKMRRDVSQCIDVSNRRVTHWRARLLWQIPLLALSWPLRQRDPTPLQPDPRLDRLEPDVWVAMGVSGESAGVIATARAQGKPSVLMIRSGADLDPRYCNEELTYSAYGERSDVCLFALQQADHIVCQTQTQLSKLETLFGRTGSLIRNPIESARWLVTAGLDRRGVLWVGRFENFAKRIDLAIQIARRCPEVPFVLIANADDPDVESSVRTDLPANVTLVDYVPFNEMPDRFAAAQVFLSTSSGAAEGFPNVLLQATACGTPIVSLDDFDEYLSRSGAGIVTGDVESAAECLREFVAGTQTIDSSVAAGYLQSHHELDKVVDEFAELLRQL